MNLQQLADKLKDNAAVTEDLMGAAEAVLVSIIGRLACWLAPLPSAILVSRAAVRVFALDGLWSVVIAAVLELIGLVTSNLWLTAKEWNQTRTRKGDPLANEALALGLMACYFVTAFLLLLAVELPVLISTGNLTGLTALLFPVLSAVGVIALNERVTHYRRVATVEGKTTTGRKPKAARKPAQRPETVLAQVADYTEIGNGTKVMARAILAERPGISGSELGRRLGRSERLGRKLKVELLPELLTHSDNGRSL